jgi:hypothetical protein
MAVIFREKHLRVEVPLTVDGINLRYDAKKNVMKKIVVLPMSSLRRITNNNEKRPAHLRATITVVEGDKLERAPAKPKQKAAPVKD